MHNTIRCDKRPKQANQGNQLKTRSKISRSQKFHESQNIFCRLWHIQWFPSKEHYFLVTNLKKSMQNVCSFGNYTLNKHDTYCIFDFFSRLNALFAVPIQFVHRTVAPILTVVITLDWPTVVVWTWKLMTYRFSGELPASKDRKSCQKWNFHNKSQIFITCFG